MSVESFLTLNLALVAAMASPGPALLVAVRTTLGGGRDAGIAIGCGLALMAATWTLFALLGLEGIFRLFPWAYTIAKTGGALYLLYIAWQTWRGAKNPVADTSRPRVHAFRDGIFVNSQTRSRSCLQPPCWS